MVTATDKVNVHLQAALDYLARGWSVIPLCPWDHGGGGLSQQHQALCKNPGKRPLIQWQPLQEQRPTEATVRTWWDKWPSANVGVAMGPVSGLLGLDVDGPEGRSLLELYGPLPPTLEFATGGGGRRLLFAYPFDVSEEQLKTARVNLPGSKKEALRFQSAGSQTVMPPSKHPSGNVYAWEVGGRPDELEPAPLPPELLLWMEKLKAPAESAPHPGSPGGAPGGQAQAAAELRARAYLLRCDPAVSGQGGHNQTFKVACKLVKGFALHPDTALRLILQDYNDRCQPPWTEKELRHKVLDAAKAPGEVGYMLNGHIPHTNGSTAGASQQTKPGPKASAQAKDKPPPPKPVVITADSLLGKFFPPIKWAIEGILPEGATVLAGRPKQGKSWLALHAALAVATGGVALGKYQVEEGEVLYLALEDGQRRLQKRLQKLLQAQGEGVKVPSRLHLATAWPRAGESGLDYLAGWCAKYEQSRLVIIDTLQRIRDRHRGDVGVYEEDYEAIAGFQQLAIKLGLAILLVTHTRKPRSGLVDDPLDEVQNSTGLTGAADAVLVLKRPRHSNDARLFVTGRDVDEREINLRWEGQYCTWAEAPEPDPNDPEAHLTPLQRKVRQLLQEAGKPLTVPEVNAVLHQDYEATAKLLQRMFQYGLLVKAGHGKYALNPDVQMSKCPNHTNPNEANG